MSFDQIEIAQIVAISDNYAIGKDNQLPWHISADLQHFKRLTNGGIVVMGRKTFESMGTKPLPNRINVVITGDFNYKSQYESVIVVHQFDEAIQKAVNLAKQKHLTTVWVIGGEKIFEQATAITDRLEITHVATNVENATAFYPNIMDNFTVLKTSEWQIDEKTGLRFQFVTYKKDWYARRESNPRPSASETDTLSN